jgi:hypothetical protein
MLNEDKDNGDCPEQVEICRRCVLHDYKRHAKVVTPSQVSRVSRVRVALLAGHNANERRKQSLARYLKDMEARVGIEPTHKNLCRPLKPLCQELYRFVSDNEITGILVAGFTDATGSSLHHPIAVSYAILISHAGRSIPQAVAGELPSRQFLGDRCQTCPLCFQKLLPGD